MQCCARSRANVEAAADSREVAVAVPFEVELCLVCWCGRLAGRGDGPRETECHGGVVGPGARGEVEVVVGLHGADVWEGAAGFEFGGPAEGVGEGEGEEGDLDFGGEGGEG